MEKVLFDVTDNYAVAKNSNGGGSLVSRLPRSLCCDVDKTRNELRVSDLNGNPRLVVKVEDISAANEYPVGNIIDLTDNDTIFTFFSAIFLGKSSSTSGGGGSSTAWELGGNSTTSIESFGTINNQNFNAITNNTIRYMTLKTGEVVFGNSVAIGNATNIGGVSLPYKRVWLNNGDANGNRLVINSSNSGVIDDLGLEVQKQGAIVYKSGYWGDGGAIGYGQTYTYSVPLVMGAANNEIRFQTGGSSPLNRVCIKQDGKVGIGTTSPTALLSVNGSANNLTGTWGVFSDASIKDILGKTAADWATVDKLVPIDFSYLDSYLGPESEFSGKTMYGFCANDVELIDGLKQFVKTVEITEGETWEWQQLEADGEPRLVMTNEGKKRNIKAIEGLDKWLISQLVLKCRDLEERLAALEGV